MKKLVLILSFVVSSLSFASDDLQLTCKAVAGAESIEKTVDLNKVPGALKVGKVGNLSVTVEDIEGQITVKMQNLEQGIIFSASGSISEDNKGVFALAYLDGTITYASCKRAK